MRYLTVISGSTKRRRQSPQQPPYFTWCVDSQWVCPKHAPIEAQIRYVVEHADYEISNLALSANIHMAVGHGSRYACFAPAGEPCAWYTQDWSHVHLVGNVLPCYEESNK